MRITFKVCFLLGSGTQGKGKLKWDYIRKKNFFNDTEENSIFSVAQRDSLFRMCSLQAEAVWFPPTQPGCCGHTPCLGTKNTWLISVHLQNKSSVLSYQISNISNTNAVCIYENWTELIRAHFENWTKNQENWSEHILKTDAVCIWICIKTDNIIIAKLQSVTKTDNLLQKHIANVSVSEPNAPGYTELIAEQNDYNSTQNQCQDKFSGMNQSQITQHHNTL
jgi:hypothetical protein